jgi:hypothetical protein
MSVSLESGTCWKLTKGKTRVKLNCFKTTPQYKDLDLQGKMARPERLELPTLCFEGRCSIQLSYGRVPLLYLTPR